MEPPRLHNTCRPASPANSCASWKNGMFTARSDICSGKCAPNSPPASAPQKLIRPATAPSKPSPYVKTSLPFQATQVLLSRKFVQSCLKLNFFFLLSSIEQSCIQRVTRRVGIDLAGRERKISVGQFHVVGKNQASSTLNVGLVSMDEKNFGTCSRDFLRVYYSDYLGITHAAQGPKFLDGEENRLEYEEWIKWMQETNPRSRVDAYPMLLICKDLLQRLARKEIQIISNRVNELLADLKMAESTNQSQQQELVLLKGELQVGTALIQLKLLTAAATEHIYLQHLFGSFPHTNRRLLKIRRVSDLYIMLPGGGVAGGVARKGWS